MKSRSLFSTAMAAIMIGGVVLAPSVALAQGRNHDSSRSQRGYDGSRNQSRRGDRSSNQRNDRQDNNSRWNGDRNQNRDGNINREDNRNRNNSPWWDANRNNDRWQDRDRDSWNRRDPDHDGDVDGRRRRPVVVYHNYNDSYYNSGYYNSGSSYGYGNGYSNRDDWRSIADAAGLLAVIGLLNHDDTLFFVGSIGALYSMDRYDNDRYSDDPSCRLRAEFFSHSYFYRDGRRYDRETVTRHGDQYYRFVCR